MNRILIKKYFSKSFDFYQTNKLLYEHVFDDIIDYLFNLYQRIQPLLLKQTNINNGKLPDGRGDFLKDDYFKTCLYFVEIGKK